MASVTVYKLRSFRNLHDLQPPTSLHYCLILYGATFKIMFTTHRHETKYCTVQHHSSRCVSTIRRLLNFVQHSASQSLIELGIQKFVSIYIHGNPSPVSSINIGSRLDPTKNLKNSSAMAGRTYPDYLPWSTHRWKSLQEDEIYECIDKILTCFKRLEKEKPQFVLKKDYNEWILSAGNCCPPWMRPISPEEVSNCSCEWQWCRIYIYISPTRF